MVEIKGDVVSPMLRLNSGDVCAINDNVNAQEDSSPVKNQVDTGRRDRDREAKQRKGWQ